MTPVKRYWVLQQDLQGGTPANEPQVYPVTGVPIILATDYAALQQQLEQQQTTYALDARNKNIRIVELTAQLEQAQGQLKAIANLEPDSHTVLGLLNYKSEVARLAAEPKMEAMTPLTLREALQALVDSVTTTYDAVAAQHLKPEFLGTHRVWCSEHSCWLYPGDVICEVSADVIKQARAALASQPVGVMGATEAALLTDAVNDESLSDAVFRIVVTGLVKGLEKPTAEDMAWAREQMAKQGSQPRVLVEEKSERSTT